MSMIAEMLSLVLIGKLHGLAVVEDLLSLKSPGTEEVFEAWERL